MFPKGWQIFSLKPMYIVQCTCVKIDRETDFFSSIKLKWKIKCSYFYKGVLFKIKYSASFKKSLHFGKVSPNKNFKNIVRKFSCLQSIVNKGLFYQMTPTKLMIFHAWVSKRKSWQELVQVCCFGWYLFKQKWELWKLSKGFEILNILIENWKRSLLTNWIATWLTELHRLLHVHCTLKNMA